MIRNRISSSGFLSLCAGILILATMAFTTPVLAASVLISESGGSTDVTEGGNPPSLTDDYTVVLDTQPAGDVTIGVTSNNVTTGVTVDESSLTFTNVNWNVSQTVTVTVVDDAIDEASPHTATISHSVTASDDLINYPLALPINSVTANITDDDSAGVSVSPTTVNIAEGGATDTYNVALTSQPTANVTITVTPDGQSTAGPSPLNFTTENWDVAQTVTVTAVNDGNIEGAHTSTISHTSDSTDGSYSGISVPSVTANITDNDAVGVTISQSSGSTNVTEGGTTDTYTVALTSNPTDVVTITITPSNSQVTVNPSLLTFTTASSQLVTVTAVDDALAEGNHNATITHSASSSDTDYDGITIDSVSVSITDNDSAAVNVSPQTVDIVEGSGDDTYEIALTSEPTAAVTITVTADSQSTVNPPVLTFDPGSGRTPQTVTVTAVDDKTNEGNHQSTITHSAVSADPGYNGVNIPDVTANITDNETQAFVTDPIGSIDNPIIVPEKNTGSFTVRLSAQPLPPVTIDATVQHTSGDADITVQSSGMLTFNSTNWDIPQTVTLAAAEDPDGSSDFATITVSATGVPSKIVTARETDDDTITVTTPNGGEVWISGTTRSIRWDSSLDFTTDVNISILLGGIERLAFLNEENSGEFTWPIPETQDIGVTYRVRVTATSNNTITDESDGDFSILDPSFDTDGDSISDFEEMGPSGMDNFYDGNGDGIPDWQLANANVASLFSFDGIHYVTFEADGPIMNMQPIQSAPDAPQEFSYPYGFFIFEFDVSALPTPAATVTMFLDGEIPDTFVKFGPTPDNFTPHFYEFAFDDATQTGAEVDDVGFSVTLSFVDGLRGDTDITENGTIGDPGAPAVIIPGGISGEEGGSDCFIATAAYGSPSAPYVKLLRDFRDTRLLTNRPGRWFVDQYYRHSPPAARWLAKHDGARALVRALLMPLVAIAWVTMNAPLIIPLMCVVAISGLIFQRVRVRAEK